MANLNAQVEDTYTVGAGNESDTLDVNTSGNGESVTVFVDDGSGGAPADCTIIAYRYSEAFGREMEYGRTTLTGNSDPVSVTDEAVPDEMRYAVVNESGAETDFRLSGVSY